MWEDDLGHFFTVDRIGGIGEASMFGLGKALSENSQKETGHFKNMFPSCVFCVCLGDVLVLTILPGIVDPTTSLGVGGWVLSGDGNCFV